MFKYRDGDGRGLLQLEEFSGVRFLFLNENTEAGTGG